MNALQGILRSFRLVILGETTCRLFYVSSPIIWIFGCFFIGVSSITIYSKFVISLFTIYLVAFGIFMLLCGIFSASNTIHICIQLPTSPIAMKIQKIGQLIILAAYLVLMLIGFSLSYSSLSNSVYKGEQLEKISSEFDSLFNHELIFLALFFLTTISCVYLSH